MSEFELVNDDQDIAHTGVRLYGDEAFIVQKEMGGHEHTVILSIAMARQTVAVLSAFLDGKNDHASDCALYSSPAEPIGPCDCQ